MLLEKINKPSYIKTFTADELNTLAGEMEMHFSSNSASTAVTAAPIWAWWKL